MTRCAPRLAGVKNGPFACQSSRCAARRGARAEEREECRSERGLLRLCTYRVSAGCGRERGNAHYDGRDERGDARLDDLGRDALESEDVRGRIAVVDGEVDAVHAVDLDGEQAWPALAFSATMSSHQGATYERMFPPRSIVRAGRSLRTRNAYCAASARQHHAAGHSATTDLRIEHDAAGLVNSQIARDQHALLL
jgi:hypothetical protein